MIKLLNINIRIPPSLAVTILVKLNVSNKIGHVIAAYVTKFPPLGGIDKMTQGEHISLCNVYYLPTGA